MQMQLMISPLEFLSQILLQRIVVFSLIGINKTQMTDALIYVKAAMAQG